MNVHSLLYKRTCFEPPAAQGNQAASNDIRVGSTFTLSVWTGTQFLSLETNLNNVLCTPPSTLAAQLLQRSSKIYIFFQAFHLKEMMRTQRTAVSFAMHTLPQGETCIGSLRKQISCPSGALLVFQSQTMKSQEMLRTLTLEAGRPVC